MDGWKEGLTPVAGRVHRHRRPGEARNDFHAPLAPLVKFFCVGKVGRRANAEVEAGVA